MRITDTNDLVSGSWEPCARFLGSVSPVCDDCGWLDHEHASADALRLSGASSRLPSSRAA